MINSIFSVVTPFIRASTHSATSTNITKSSLLPLTYKLKNYNVSYKNDYIQKRVVVFASLIRFFIA